jgi:hypothetical protein
MGLMVRTIGLARARTRIGMANLAYNVRRLVQLQGRVTARHDIAGPVCTNRLTGGQKALQTSSLTPVSTHFIHQTPIPTHLSS